MIPEGSKRTVSSVDHNQTAPLGPVQSGLTVCPEPSVQKHRIIIVYESVKQRQNNSINTPCRRCAVGFC